MSIATRYSMTNSSGILKVVVLSVEKGIQVDRAVSRHHLAMSCKLESSVCTSLMPISVSPWMPPNGS